MKRLRQVLCVFVSVLMMVSLLAVDVSAASSPKLSKTTLTMLVGKTSELKVTGTKSTVKWSSSDSSVCTVSSKGKLKAVAAGSARITAKVGKKKLICKVTVVNSYIKAISDKQMKAGDTATLSLKHYNVEYANAYSSDEKVAKVKKCYISGDKIKVKVEAVSNGIAYINICDKKNKKTAVRVKIHVKGNLSDAQTQGGEGGSSVKVIVDGDGDTSLIMTPGSRNASSSVNGKTSPSADRASEILELVNAERAKLGIPALTLDDDLCGAAQTRAKEVGKKFSHIRPDGRDCFSIFEDYGIVCWGAGENIAQGSSTSKGAMNQWMNSSGHRANILSSNWTKLGVGYDSATKSWVQIFTE